MGLSPGLMEFYEIGHSNDALVIYSTNTMGLFGSKILIATR
jgi:hypothetical protein